MTKEQFIWWAHGFFEIANPQQLTSEQVQEIKNHLDLVFNRQKTIFDFKTSLTPQIVQDKIFITISKEPIYDKNTTYSYFPDTDKNIVNWAHNYFPSGQNPVAYLVIDNKLAPRETNYSNMSYNASNHLVGTVKNSPGICNIGTYKPGNELIC